MVKVKIFDYTEEKENGHLKSAQTELKNLGAKNISYLPDGKPVAENCFVSISHSHGKCAVCVSDNPVGIDIEKIEDRTVEKILNRVFSDLEKDYFNSNGKSLIAFYEIWTRKEAYSKISGDGLKDVLGRIDTFSLCGYKFDTKSVDGYVLTICEKTE